MAYHVHIECLLAEFHIWRREVELLQAHTSGIILKRPADISISFCSDQNWLFFTGNWTNCAILSQTLTFF